MADHEEKKQTGRAMIRIGMTIDMIIFVIALSFRMVEVHEVIEHSQLPQRNINVVTKFLIQDNLKSSRFLIGLWATYTFIKAVVILLFYLGTRVASNDSNPKKSIIKLRVGCLLFCLMYALLATMRLYDSFLDETDRPWKIGTGVYAIFASGISISFIYYFGRLIQVVVPADETSRSHHHHHHRRRKIEEDDDYDDGQLPTDEDSSTLIHAYQVSSVPPPPPAGISQPPPIRPPILQQQQLPPPPPVAAGRGFPPPPPGVPGVGRGFPPMLQQAPPLPPGAGINPAGMTRPPLPPPAAGRGIPGVPPDIQQRLSMGRGLLPGLVQPQATPPPPPQPSSHKKSRHSRKHSHN